MENLLKIVLKGFLFGIGFVIGTFVIYAAGSLINSVTEQKINKGDKIGSGWFQDVNNKIISLIDNQTTISGEVSYNTERLNEVFRIGNQMNPGKSCKDILDTNPNTAGQDGIYWIDPDGDGGVSAFEVYCDMTTDGGGWIKLTTSRTRNYWSYGLSSSNNNDKCGYDGLSTQTDGNYTHDGRRTSSCENFVDIDYHSNGFSLTDNQIVAIRGLITELNTSTKLFAGSCDDDGSSYERSHEVRAYDNNGNYIYLTNGYNGDDSWYNVSFINNNNIASKYLIPDRFWFKEEYNCNNGGGAIAGWTNEYILVK